MAKKVITVVVDIEFPDGMLDDEYGGPAPGGRKAGFRGELGKIIRDGCSENSFDYTSMRPSSLFVQNHAELMYDLVEQ